jgi:hypothetical protein
VTPAERRVSTAAPTIPADVSVCDQGGFLAIEMLETSVPHCSVSPSFWFWDASQLLLQLGSGKQ